MPKTAAFIVINGLGQDVTPSVGLFNFYWLVFHLFYDRRDTLIMHITEDADMSVVAWHIDKHNPIEIHIAAYSLGAGRGTDNLAPELEARGRVIDSLYLIDPVQDTGWLGKLSWLRPAALGWSGRDLVYRAPRNVAEVHSWRQVNHRSPFQPVGHRVVATNKQTTVHPELVYGDSFNLRKYAADVPEAQRRLSYDMTHATIDNDPDIHRQIVELLTKRIKPPEPCEVHA